MSDVTAAGLRLAHSVYFTLKDRSPEAVDGLLAACNKYLSDHEGVIFFGAGRLVADLERPVNDRDFDVALQVMFVDRAAHDRYQTHERHLAFIAENKATWARVRVFDADLV